MLSHVVLLQPRPETTEDQVTTALDHVKALQQAIFGILDIQAGKNMSTSHQGYTYGFIIRFADSEHFQTYAPHSAHQPVSEELQRLCQKIIDFDIT